MIQNIPVPDQKQATGNNENAAFMTDKVQN